MLSPRNKRARKIAQKLSDDLLWNGPIDYAYSAYIEIGFAVLINLAFPLLWTSWGMYFSNAWMLTCAAILVLFPIWVIYFLYKNWDDLEEEEMKAQFESCYPENAPLKSRWEILSNCFFLGSRLLLLITFVFVRDPVLQIILLNTITTARFIYQGIMKPFETR